MSLAVETVDLTKKFPKGAGYKELVMPWKRSFMTALDGVSIRVEKGEILGLLGLNGAGKTTLMRILSTLVLPDHGHALIHGYDVVQHPARIKSLLSYVVSDERSLFWRLTGRQNLRFFSLLNEIPRRQVDEYVQGLLGMVGLEHAADERLMRYSSGMRQRLGIARGLIGDPDVLLLDEPTRSLDPVSAERIWMVIRDELVRKSGRTVIVATHNMEEAAFLCDHVAILHSGRVRAYDTVDGLKGIINKSERCLISVSNASAETLTSISAIDGVQDVTTIAPNGHNEHTLELVLEDPLLQVPTVVTHLVGGGGRVLQVMRQPPTLTQVLASLTGSAD